MQVLLYASKLWILKLCFLLGNANSTVFHPITATKGHGIPRLQRNSWTLRGDRAHSFLCAGHKGEGRRIFMKIEGTKSGVFTTGPEKDVVPKGYIEVTGLTFEARSGREAGSGQSTGRRQYKAIEIAKEIDYTTTYIFNAFATNEPIKEVKLQFFQEYPSQEAHYSITLKNATISGVTQQQFTERIYITFTKIEINFGENFASDDWLSPQ